MTGYVRVDTSNNIADGNVISAADLDNEFDGIQAAFNASTGHNHDGTTGEGAPISVLGPTQDVVVGASTVTPKTTNTVDIGSSSLKFKDLYLAGNASIGGTLAVTGATTLSAALTYGGVTLSNAVTGTGNMVLSASPTLTGTLSGANASLSGTLAVTGVATLTAQPILSSLTASRAVFTDGSKGLVSNAITGTGNVVMSASPTLTGTISAEALTTSSTVTLNGGTANGVAYLNGSKVLTTGSALTFDGTNFTIGSMSNTGGGRVEALSNATSAYTARSTSTTGANGGTTAVSLRTVDSSASYWANAAYDAWEHIFRISGSTEQMRLTSTGLGIGTSSPSATAKVTVRDASYGLYRAENTVGGVALFGITANATSNGFLDSTNSFLFNIDGTERMRLTSTGLGIGTSSPSAKLHVNNGAGCQLYVGLSNNIYSQGYNHIWQNLSGVSTFMTLNESGNLGIGTSSPVGKLDVSGTTYSRFLNTTAPTLNNDTHAGEALYLRSGGSAGSGNVQAVLAFGKADSSSQRSGAAIASVQTTADADQIGLGFYVSSGTASLQTMTQAAIIDSSGNLGLGVTPSAWNSAYKAMQVGSSAALWSIGSGAGGGYLTNNVLFDSSFGRKYIVTGNATEYAQVSGQHQWLIAPSGTAGNAISFTQAMTLDASGNLLVGTTTPQVNSGGRGNITINGSTDAVLALGIGGVNTAYIFNNASLLIVNAQGSRAITFETNSAERARIDSSGNLLVGTTASGGQSGFAVLKGGSGIETRIEIAHNFGTASGVKYVDFLYATGTIGSITQNGTTAVAYNTSSDYRLKNITGPITTSGAYIDSLNPVEGTWKADGSTFVGLIAHEVQEASRTTVATGVKDGEEMQGMDYSSAEIIANLIAEVKALRTRVAALESI